MIKKMFLTAYTDGASKGNPGPAATGFTIEKDGVLLDKYHEYIGKTTNNIAEYTAVIAAVKRMESLGATDVIVYSDSELLARQINGIYKVKSKGLKPLFREVIGLSEKFVSFRVIHIPREENSIADGLANKAIKEHNKNGKKPKKPFTFTGLFIFRLFSFPALTI